MSKIGSFPLNTMLHRATNTKHQTVTHSWCECKLFFLHHHAVGGSRMHLPCDSGWSDGTDHQCCVYDSSHDCYVLDILSHFSLTIIFDSSQTGNHTWPALTSLFSLIPCSSSPPLWFIQSYSIFQGSNVFGQTNITVNIIIGFNKGIQICQSSQVRSAWTFVVSSLMMFVQAFTETRPLLFLACRSFSLQFCLQ